MYSDILMTVDFDRTLTAPDSTIPERNIEAIRHFIDNGGTFTVNTGRSIPMSVHNLIPYVPVNAPLLLYNGSAAYDTQTNTLTRFAPIDIAPTVLIPDLKTNFPELNIEIQALDAHYLTEKNPGFEKYSSHNNCAWGYTTPETVPQPFIKLSLYGEFRKDTVADMYNATAEDLALFDKAINYVKNKYGDKLEILRACARIVDFHAKGVSKLHSAQLLQNELGKKILICVGDAENDIAMLDGADYAFCPADGIVADRYPNVCNCAEGAIADVIYKKIPEILQNKP